MPLEKLFAKVTKLLNHVGKFIFCYDSKQIDDIIYFAKEYKLPIESLQFVHSNEQKESSLIFVQIKKGSFAKIKIFPPLIITSQSKEIYQKTRTYSIKCKI